MHQRGKSGYRLSQLRDVTSDEENFKEKEEREALAKEAHDLSEYNRKFNQFEGLWHDDDGLRKFPNGQVVGGVNDYGQSFAQHRVNNLVQATGVDVADQNIVQDEIDLKKKQKMRAKALARSPFSQGIYNEFDGLIHTIAGKKIDPETGHLVENQDLQLKRAGGDNFDFGADLKLRLQAAEDSPDGLIHNEDGTTVDPTTNK